MSLSTGDRTTTRSEAQAGVEYDGTMKSHRSRWIIAICLLLVLLLAVAVISGVIGGRRGAPRAAAAAPSVTPSQVPSSSATPSSTGTSSSSTSDTGLIEAPHGVTWQLFEGVALPTSRTDGPRRVAGPVHAGYTDTPTGALVAAEQIDTRRLITPASGWKDVVERQLVPGPGRDAYANVRKQVTDTGAPNGGYAQIAGFRFITFSPQLAVVSVANRSPSGVLQVTTLTVRWLDGDWKLELPPSGLSQPQTVQDLTGYVPWSGVS